VAFKQGAFQDLPAAVGTGFDAVLCLGNSLVHVLDEDAVRQSLAAMAACLRPGGMLVLHNLNYDKRLAEKPRWFQVNSGIMDGQETLIWRFADYSNDLITFNISVFQKGSDGRWTVQVQSTPQRPWQSHELVRFVAEAGFTDIRSYGNLGAETYDTKTSGDLVIVGRRSTPA
jgi:glycine/sarcosine N-methyltransferase